MDSQLILIVLRAKDTGNEFLAIQASCILVAKTDNKPRKRN